MQDPAFNRRAVLAALVAAGAWRGLPAFAQQGAAEVLLGLPTGRKLHGLAIYGDLKYGAGFGHFDYADPAAPKGGEIRQAVMGGFDSLNPFIIRGDAAAGAAQIYETLTVQSFDEAFSEYGLIAETIEVGPDAGFVEYGLREAARFHDGKPVTAADVVFSFTTLKEKGNPFYRNYYAGVAKAEAKGERVVRFTFGGTPSRELPLIMGQLPVLPAHVWQGRDFESPGLDVTPGSGAYRVARVEAGRSIVLERVPDYWGAGLGVNAGQNNFDRIRYDYYRDDTAMMEAFKAGLVDVRLENSAQRWATGYDFPALAQGRAKKVELPDRTPQGIQAFAFNLRRPKFQDRRVRRALGLCFDFEWSNQRLFYGAYKRCESYFSNSELAATGTPGPAELALLEPLRDRVPAEVFGEAYKAPVSDASGQDRALLRQARGLLQEAGCTVADGRLSDPQGKPFTIEFLLDSPVFERVIEPYGQNLKLLGIAAVTRTIDAAQYVNRVQQGDFDMVTQRFPQSSSPGNEQRDYWGSAAADMPGSSNIIGIKDPAVDRLVDAVIEAGSRAALVAACRALDRVLTWNAYAVPQWYLGIYRLAYWDRFGRPETPPPYALGLPDLWWIDAQKDKALGRAGG